MTTRPASSSAPYCISLLKLAGFLLILPAAVTYLHLSSQWNRVVQASHAELVQVRVTATATTTARASRTRKRSENDSINGIYLRVSSDRYTRVLGLRLANADAVQFAEYVKLASLVLLSPFFSLSINSDWYLIQSSDLNGRWSLMTTKQGEDELLAVSIDKTVCGSYFIPLPAAGKVENGRDMDPTMLFATVTCLSGQQHEMQSILEKNTGRPPVATESSVHSLGFRKNPNKTTPQQTQQSPLLELLLYTPATACLMALNGILFAIYWSRQVDPSAVAMSYKRIVHDGEAWRSLSGATAHFEIWHLGFNMMSLYALGRELEGTGMYTSVAFMFLNLSLIPLTTLVWCGLQYVYLEYLRRHPNGGSSSMSESDRLTLGYSGVLFAWMVVAALNQQETCPIFFLPQICFKTFVFGGIPFSFAPIVQLVAASMILPRVSFTGHLAGLLVGFVMHWGFLPVSLIQPTILVPLMYFLHLKYVRRIMPSWRQIADRFCCLIPIQFSDWLLRAYLIVSFVLIAHTIWINDAGKARMTVQLVLVVVYWLASSCPLSGDNSVRRDSLYKAFVFIAVLVLLNDSMAIGAEIAVPGLWSMSAIVLSSIRWILLCAAACCGCDSLVVQSDGIFLQTLGYTTIEPGRHVGHRFRMIFSGDQNSIYMVDSEEEYDLPRRVEWAPFLGQGHVLGTRMTTMEQSDREEGTTI